MNRTRHRSYCAALLQEAAAAVRSAEQSCPATGRSTAAEFESHWHVVDFYGMFLKLAPDDFWWERWQVRRTIRQGVRQLIRHMEQYVG